MVNYLGHLDKRLLALGGVQAVAGADDSKLLCIDGAIGGRVLQVEHEVHVAT